MLSKALSLLSLTSLVAASANEDVKLFTTPPTTKCSTIGKDPHTTRTYSRNRHCTNYVTEKTIIHTSTVPVTTSVVFNTSTVTASEITSVATVTSSLTITETTAITETDTSLSIVSITDTLTSLMSFTGSTPSAPTTAVPVTTPRITTPSAPTLLIRGDERAGPTRPAPKPGVICVVDRCLRRTMHVKVTQTTTLPTSTATSISQITTTVTPLASVTSTVTANFTTFSTITDMTTLIQTSTLTQTITQTSLPNFNIIAEKVSDPASIPDGSELNTNALSGTANFATSSNNGGSTYSIDTVTGQLMDTSSNFYAYTVGSAPGFVFFDSLPAILATSGSSLCQCAAALTLSCSCGGATVWQMNGAGDLVIGNELDSLLYSSVTPVVSVVGSGN